MTTTDPGPRLTRLRVGDAELGVATWEADGNAAGHHDGTDRPTIVLLHDGLGSVAQWRAVPERLAARTGRRVVAFDRPGHGSSTPVPQGPWPTLWLHDEAERLVGVLAALGLRRPLLVGHSDGGSIALIAARDGLDVEGVVAIAAHSWVEPVCRGSIEAMRANADPIVAGLARFHEHPAEVFEAWSGVWVSEEFGRWDLRPTLGSLSAPVVIAQGDADEYATDAMVTDTVAAIGANARAVVVPGGRHLLHHHDPDAVVDLVAAVADSAIGPTATDGHDGS